MRGGIRLSRSVSHFGSTSCGMSATLMDPPVSADETSKRNKDDVLSEASKSVWDYGRQWFKTAFQFCEAYGSVIAYNGASFGAFLAALFVPIMNESSLLLSLKNRFEGGCKYPYLSEVARSGLGWWCFFTGSFIGCVPWILFSISYYRCFTGIAMTLTNEKRRKWLVCLESVMLAFNILSSLGMVLTAFFDMGHYPYIHEYVCLCYNLYCIERDSVCRPSQPRIHHQLR